MCGVNEGGYMCVVCFVCWWGKEGHKVFLSRYLRGCGLVGFSGEG